MSDRNEWISYAVGLELSERCLYSHFCHMASQASPFLQLISSSVIQTEFHHKDDKTAVSSSSVPIQKVTT